MLRALQEGRMTICKRSLIGAECGKMKTDNDDNIDDEDNDGNDVLCYDVYPLPLASAIGLLVVADVLASSKYRPRGIKLHFNHLLLC